MILDKNVITDEKGKKYIECVFDSSNISKTIYFENNNKFYIFFKRGHGYSYINVDKDLYEEFEKADSQGKFFNQKIKTNPIHQYKYEYKLFEEEIKEIEETIKKYKDRENGESSRNIIE